MSLKVYFGTTLINEDYYTGLTNNFELFNESFKLGATPSNTYKLTIAKEGVSSQPTSVILKDGNDIFAELKVDNIEEKDGMYYEYTLTDKMLDLDFYYDASEIFNNGSTTLLAIAQDICTKAGLTLGTTNFRGYNKEISWYDNRRTAREYIGMIAELNGGFARIENDVLYFRKQKTNSVSTIDIDECENFTIGEYHKITRVIYELGALKYEFGDETGNTLYLNNSNVFITEESEVQAIYNDIKNFEFYSFETSNCPIDSNVLAGDVITFTDGTNNYPTIAQYDLEYFGGWIGGYSLDINTERQEETKIVGTQEHIKNIQITVDRDANRIDELVETTDTIEGQVNNILDTTNTSEGKYIYLDDSSDQPIIDIRLNGETSQATRSGKNLLKVTATSQTVNGVTLTVNPDKTITANGTATAQVQFYLDTSSFNGIIKEAGNYFLSATDTDSSSTYFIQVQLATADEGKIYLSSTNSVGVPLTISNTFRSYIIIRSGVTVNNVVFKPQFEKSSTKTDYEPYGVMPSPDYPSPIVNVEGRNIASLETSETKVVGGIPFTVENGIININGTTSNGTFYFDTFRVKSGTATFWIEATGYTDKPNSNAFIILQESSDNSTWTSKSELSLLSTSTKQSQVTLDNSKYYRMRIYVAGNTFTNATIKVQLEYGSKTDFVPYNNIQVKKCNANIIKITDEINTTNSGVTITGDEENQIVKFNGTLSNTYCYSSVLHLSNPINTGIFRANFKSNCDAFIVLVGKNTSWLRRMQSSSSTNIVVDISTLSEPVIALRFGIEHFISGTSVDYEVGYQLTMGSELTPYIKHQSKTYNFPLSEGQELMEGTYLADDGIHNIHKQVTFNGSDTSVITSIQTNETTQNTTFVFRNSFAPDCKKGSHSAPKCNQLIGTSNYNYRNFNNQIVQWSDTSASFCLGVSTNNVGTTQASIENYFSSNPLTIEYLLAEEEIVPYTPEQQEAWNEITSMNTYMSVTHIYSDAYANIMYVRNNGLNIYETRDNAQRQYQTTTNKFAEQEITNESIISKVAEQETTIDTISGEVTSSTSRINTLEETVNGLSNTVYEKGGNNLFYYSKEFWRGQDEQKTVTRPIQVGDNLSGKTLALSFPVGFSFGDVTNLDIITGANNYKISSKQVSVSLPAAATYQVVTASQNGTDTTLYQYNVTNSSITTNLTSITLSDSFGTVTSINTNSPAYQYIQVQETKTENILNIQEVNGGEFGTNSESGLGYIVGNGSSYQEINEIPNGAYTISFMYKKVGSALSEGSVKINDISYNLTETSWTKFTKTINVSTNSIKLEFIANTDNTLYIADLLANIGTQANSWTQNANEVRTDTVKIGKGIEVSSSTKDTKLKADADGVRIVQASDERNEVAVFTKDGTETKQLKVNEKAEISELLIQKVGDQIWLSSLL